MSEADTNLDVREGRDDLPVFIHSELDDYGLTNVEFRVYARLARRAGSHGRAREGVPSMADAFDVSTRTIRRALRVLVKCRIIAEHLRPGKPTVYTLNPRSVWAPRRELKETRRAVWGKGDDTTTPVTPVPHVTPDTTDRGGLTPQTGVPLTPGTGEGSPLKVLPEGTPVETLSGAGAREAVGSFTSVYGHEPHVHGQTEIEAEVADDFDHSLWLEVLRQCRANLTPAKNVGTILKIYREQKERRRADTERASERRRTRDGPAGPAVVDDLTSREVFIEDLMHGYDLTEEQARERFPKLRSQRDAA
jgi:hypothetical protein